MDLENIEKSATNEDTSLEKVVLDQKQSPTGLQGSASNINKIASMTDAEIAPILEQKVNDE